MDNQPSETILPQLRCQACSSNVTADDFFCQNCGFPLRAPAEERDAFINNRNFQAFQLKEMQGKIKNASTSIFVIGGLTSVMGIILYFTAARTQDSFVAMLVNLLVGIIFLGLGFWCKEKPVAAIISALSLYIILLVLTAIDDPLNVVKGIILKIIIIGYLIKGLNSAFEAQRIKKKHNL